MKTLTVVERTWDFVCHFAITNDDNEAKEHFILLGAKDDDFEGLDYAEAYLARFEYTLNNGAKGMHYCIYLREDWKPNDLAHEVVHLGVDVLTRKGAVVNLENDEQLARVVDFVILEFMAQVEKC